MINQSLSRTASSKTSLGSIADKQLTERGAIFTRRDVVEFLLDLIGYTSDKPLYAKRILEPSFGEGDFLLVIVERLLSAYQALRPQNGNVVEDLKNCISGVELHPDSLQKTSIKLVQLLVSFGLTMSEAEALMNAWLIPGDYLLLALPSNYAYVIGNPPYIRQELIPDNLLAEYRKRYITLFDRADLYIPFIEKSLSLLAPSGSLGFICSDRWTKNRYGGPLRKLVAQRYHLKYYVDMMDIPAFLSEVTAYPSIFIIANESAGPTRVAHRLSINSDSFNQLVKDLHESTVENDRVKEICGVTSYSQPWILESFDQLSLLRRLEETLPAIEEAGCKVGIGVATGADDIFIGECDALDVESDRKIPLLLTKDIVNGTINWLGKCIINPFKPNGDLVDLNDYPKLNTYLTKNQLLLKKRHVAMNSPKYWYRTIDRINPVLTTKPKLLIPDIKGFANVVFDEGHFYPHHNLYYVISDYWDLRALQAVLLSGVSHLFVSMYSTKMNGGCLRFQAQYLRRIRIPYWNAVSQSIKSELIEAAQQNNIPACNAATYKLYELSKEELSAIGGNGN
ncbi:MAG: modification methylase PaeR7I [Dehalococcoidia bacterium]|nr:MAG: modification methylase PaeR7I [Dehalococcoidia bacterium]